MSTGYGEAPTENTRNCPVCGEPGRYIPARRVPKAGPLVLEGWHAHVDDGDVYYHKGEAAPDETGPAEELTDAVEQAPMYGGYRGDA